MYSVFNKSLNNKPATPCKDCMDRATGGKSCHSTCIRYIKYKQNLESTKLKERNTENSAYISYLFDKLDFKSYR